MATHFLVLMAGLIFGLIHFRIGGVELFPNFIGFALIAISCHLLSQYTAKFQIPARIAIPLVFLSGLRYFLSPLAASILFLVNSVLTILLIWFVLAALIRFTEERERPDLAETTVKYRRIYVAVATVTFLFHLAAVFEPESASGFVAMMAIAMMVVVGLLLRLLWVIRHESKIDLGQL